MKTRIFAALALALFSLVAVARAVDTYDDVPMGLLPPDSVKTAVQKTLSPQGRFAILQELGVVRIFDTPDKIAEVRAALKTMQDAPAVVSFAITFRTGMHEVTQGQSTDTGVYAGYDTPPLPAGVGYGYVGGVGGYGYGYGGYGHGGAPPTKILITGGGTKVITPGQQKPWGGGGQPHPPGPPGPVHPYYPPGGYGYGSYGYGGGYVYQGGYTTGTVVTTEETGVTGGVIHSFTGNTLIPKPVAVSLCARVPNAELLRDWAIKNAGVDANEPAWPAASAELVVTPEITNDGLVLHLLPRIVLAGPRVIPLKVCEASVTIKPGAPAAFEGFPGADADFYYLFLGARESTGDALTQINVGAAVRYVPPQPAATDGAAATSGTTAGK